MAGKEWVRMVLLNCGNSNHNVVFELMWCWCFVVVVVVVGVGVGVGSFT